MPRRCSSPSIGAPLSEFLSLSALGKAIPLSQVHAALHQTGRASQRQRDLPAHVMVYYVIALSLYMADSGREVLRRLLEGMSWLQRPGQRPKVNAKSALTQARTRLGEAPVQELYGHVAHPIAEAKTVGAWYRQWRLVVLDGSTLAVPDTPANVAVFGRPGTRRGHCAFPRLRLVSLLEAGTHVLFGSVLGGFHDGETVLAKQVLPHLQPGMLCLADRNFFSFKLWQQAQATGAHLLWRVKKSLVLPVEEALPDGSYLSTIRSPRDDRSQPPAALRVRVIEYTVAGGKGKKASLFRLLTTLLDGEAAPARELADLYPERWEVEITVDEGKTHLRGGAQVVLRSRTPVLVRQEVWGFLLAHFVVRGLMHEAALAAQLDPDRLSFIHSLRVLRRKLPQFAAFPP